MVTKLFQDAVEIAIPDGGAMRVNVRDLKRHSGSAIRGSAVSLGDGETSPQDSN